MRVEEDSGLTLLELAVVMAIFSLVAAIALQALSGAMATRSRVSVAAAETSNLAATTALLRRDLRAMVPVPPEGGGMAFTQQGQRLALTVAGQPRLPDARRDALARVTWEVTGQGRLRRSSEPLEGDGSAHEMTMLTGVTGWNIRSLGHSGAWRDQVPDDPALARTLPAAVEVRFDLEGLGDIRVFVAR